jgi:hypothetical protein
MMRVLRYILATFCFAASVGCLLLWGRNVLRHELTTAKLSVASFTLRVQICEGLAAVGLADAQPNDRVWQAHSLTITESAPLANIIRQQGRFGMIGSYVFFPLWYASLIFALAGVGVLRLSRQFSIRSALIVTSVVAALIGMAVIL